MPRRKLFLWLAAASGYTGLGLVLGYALSDQTKNAALWIGGLLILLAALLLGMFISARPDPQAVDDDEPPVSSSSNITDLPRS